MRSLCRGAAVLLALGFSAATSAEAQAIDVRARNFNEQTLRPAGAPVYPVYEGWYRAEDGTRRLCWGYLNANTEATVEIPLGPENFIEPAQFDGVQPNHFRPIPARDYRRDYCVFTIVWPESYDDDDRITWTLYDEGVALSAPGHVMTAYELDDRASPGRGDVAADLRLGPDGPVARGRTGATRTGLTARVGEPLPLTVQVTHPDPGSWLIWAKHVGPGEVTFSEPLFRVAEDGTGTSSATFGAPGEYLLRVQTINSLGSFDFYCCWTNGYLSITVDP